MSKRKVQQPSRRIMHLTKNKIGPDEWESWPPAARAAIEELEALLGATRTQVRVMFEILHQHSDLMTSHQEDVARKAFKHLIEESRALKTDEKESVVCPPPVSKRPLRASNHQPVIQVELPGPSSTTATGREL